MVDAVLPGRSDTLLRRQHDLRAAPSRPVLDEYRSPLRARPPLADERAINGDAEPFNALSWEHRQREPGRAADR